MNKLLYNYLVEFQNKELLVDLVMSEKAFEVFKLAINEYNNSNYKQALYLLNSLRSSDLDIDLKKEIANLELETANKLKEIKLNG